MPGRPQKYCTKDERRSAHNFSVFQWRMKNKERIRLTARQWRDANPEKVKEYNKRRREKHQLNPHIKREQARVWKKNNKHKVTKWDRERKRLQAEQHRMYEQLRRLAFPEAIREQREKTYIKNLRKIKLRRKRYIKTHKEQLKVKARIYYQQNKKQILQAAKIRHYHRLKTEPKYRLKFMTAKEISRRLRHNYRWKEAIKLNYIWVLPYTLDQLKKHLSSKFKRGMTWKNYGSKWHIDHIIPDSHFRYKTYDDEGFKQSWALSNLQPLWAAENLAKGSKIQSV